VNRREIIAVLALPALARPAWAQQTGRVYRLALPITTIHADDAEGLAKDPFYAPFRKELVRLGYVEGGNLKLEWWSAAGNFARFPELSAAVARSNPDVIAVSSPQFALELKKATSSIPIVAIVEDPLRNGIAASLARPGGNITGHTGVGLEYLGKRLELLKEIVPGIRKVGYFGPRNLAGAPAVQAIRDAATQLRLEIFEAYLDSPVSAEGFRRAFEELRAAGVEALYPGGGSEIMNNYPTIIRLAEEARLPVLYAATRAIEEGGLAAITLGSPAEYATAMAGYVDRILKGEKPGDLPIQTPAVVRLTLNVKAAKRIGLTFPEAILARADEVIE
jgi:putative ABC transport system substrate-binding protein